MQAIASASPAGARLGTFIASANVLSRTGLFGYSREFFAFRHDACAASKTMPKLRQWTQLTEPKICNVALENQTEKELKQLLRSWVKETERSGKVERISIKSAQGGVAWGKCRCQQKCPATWRWDLDTADGGGFTISWFEQGEHPRQAENEADMKKKERAQQVAHLTPLQAHARLLADKNTARDSMPTVQVPFLVQYIFEP